MQPALGILLAGLLLTQGSLPRHPTPFDTYARTPDPVYAYRPVNVIEGQEKWWGQSCIVALCRLARTYWKTGLAEMFRDWSKKAFTAGLKRYLPEIEGKDLVFGPSGVRAQALNADGTLVEDFSIGESAHALHVRNALSPAATASLAIGREIADLAIARFGLG